MTHSYGKAYDVLPAVLLVLRESAHVSAGNADGNYSVAHEYVPKGETQRPESQYVFS